MQRRILILLLLLLPAAGLGGVSNSADDLQDSAPPGIFEEFSTRIYPLLTRNEGGCFDCHAADSHRDLVFSGNVEEDFQMLIDGQYLDESGPDSLIGAMASANEKLRMPKDNAAWSEQEIAQLRRIFAITQARSIEPGGGG